MAELNDEVCVACRADAPHVTDQEVTELRSQVPEWKLLEENGVRKLERTFPFSNFLKALAFSNQVGELAESQGHHPRITTEWGTVTVTWWTHKIRDLHRNDFIMAAKTDRLYK